MQVERKIDGLFASLVDASITADTTLASASAPVECERPSRLGGEFAPQANQRRRTIAPGTWLPFPSSFEQRPEPPGEPAEQVEGEDAMDRQYIEQLRGIHNFADSDDVRRYPEGLFQPSKRREEPIEHALIDALLTTGEAETLLNEYRKMSHSFPFVPLAQSISAWQLYQNAPMLFLAMVTAASWRDHQRQLSLDAIFRQELANRTIIRPRRNLSLVQSVLVYLSW